MCAKSSWSFHYLKYSYQLVCMYGGNAERADKHIFTEGIDDLFIEAQQVWNRPTTLSSNITNRAMLVTTKFSGFFFQYKYFMWQGHLSSDFNRFSLPSRPFKTLTPDTKKTLRWINVLFINSITQAYFYFLGKNIAFHKKKNR